MGEPRLIASTDDTVKETQRRLDEGPEGGKPKSQADPLEPRRRRRRRPSEAKPVSPVPIDLAQMSQTARGFAEAGKKVWTDLIEGEDILSKAVPFVLIGVGIAIVAGRIIARRNEENP